MYWINQSINPFPEYTVSPTNWGVCQSWYFSTSNRSCEDTVALVLSLLCSANDVGKYLNEISNSTLGKLQQWNSSTLISPLLYRHFLESPSWCVTTDGVSTDSHTHSTSPEAASLFLYIWWTCLWDDDVKSFIKVMHIILAHQDLISRFIIGNLHLSQLT